MVAMAHARTIATFFVVKNRIRMEVYHEKILIDFRIGRGNSKRSRVE